MFGTFFEILLVHACYIPGIFSKPERGLAKRWSMVSWLFLGVLPDAVAPAKRKMHKAALSGSTAGISRQ